MIRVSILLLTLGVGGAVVSTGSSTMWPLRATVTDLHGQPVAFRAVTLGGDLIMVVGEGSLPNNPRQALPDMEALRHGDTVRATTPATYPLDLRRGPVAFFTRGRDSIRVAVRRFPFDGLWSVTGVGRQLTIRDADSRVTIDAR